MSGNIFITTVGYASDELNQTLESRSNPKTEGSLCAAICPAAGESANGSTSHEPNNTNKTETEPTTENDRNRTEEIFAAAPSAAAWSEQPPESVYIPVTIQPTLLTCAVVCSQFSTDFPTEISDALIISSIYASIDETVKAIIRKSDVRQRFFSPAQLTRLVLGKIREHYFDEFRAIFRYAVERCSIGGAALEDLCREAGTFAAKAEEKYRVSLRTPSESWCWNLSTDALVRLTKLEPVAFACRAALSEISMRLSSTLFTVIYKCYCDERTAGYPVTTVIDTVKEALKDKKMKPQQTEEIKAMEAKLPDAMEINPELGMSETAFICKAFYSRECRIRALLSIGDTLFSRYEFNGIRPGTRKASPFLERKKTVEFTDLIEDNSVTCQQLLDYVCSGMFRHMGVNIPLSVYHKIRDELMEQGILEAPVEEVIELKTNGSYRGCTGRTAHVKYIESSVVKLNKRFGSDIVARNNKEKLR